MKILSIHDGHNASVCYFEDGKIIFAIQEERLNKKKNYLGPPVMSIKKIFEEYHLEPSDFDCVIFPFKHSPLPFDVSKIRDEWKNTFEKNIYRTRIKKLLRRTPFYTIHKRQTRKIRISQYTKLGFKESQIIFMDHHEAHAATAYFGSPWFDKNEDVLILTLDGGGDGLCATISIGSNGNVKRISQTSDLNSLGNIYSRATFMLGFTPWEHEYKVMGMAPYVSKKYGEESYSIFSSYLSLDDNDSLKFKSSTSSSLLYKKMSKDTYGIRFDNICRGLQDFTEDLIVSWVQKAIRKTGIKKLACAGGVFMNVKANKRIMEIPSVEDLFIFPSCGDETNVFGACWHIYSKKIKEENLSGKIEKFEHMYFGNDIKDSEVESFFSKNKSKYVIQKENNIGKTVGELLSDNKVVARASGTMEFGARALGNRSILSNASDLKNVQHINQMIKKRDFWMPFAPVILEERESDYLINKKGIDSRFMIMSFDTTDKRDDIIGAVHQADYTARPQIINEKINKEYYNILKSYESLTSFGGMMNTSFNLHGLPIVSDVEDAMYVMNNSGLDTMQLSNYIITKEN
tara:strand:+ start:306 stop:2024 length:1719 start_codon:yes stop_codon:yes gene_type:complete